MPSSIEGLFIAATEAMHAETSVTPNTKIYPCLQTYKLSLLKIQAMLTETNAALRQNSKVTYYMVVPTQRIDDQQKLVENFNSCCDNAQQRACSGLLAEEFEYLAGEEDKVKTVFDTFFGAEAGSTMVAFFNYCLEINKTINDLLEEKARLQVTNPRPSF